MKRSDLKVGETYYASRSNDWGTEYSPGRKVVVVSLKPLAKSYGRRARPDYMLTLEDGTVANLGATTVDANNSFDRATDVAVRYEDGSYGTEATREIRGTWAECTARRAEIAEIKRAASQAEAERTRVRLERWAALRARLEKAGCTSWFPQAPAQYEVTISFTDLERLLDLRKG